MTGPEGRARAVTVPSGRVARASRLGGLAASVATDMAINGVREFARGRRPSSRDLVLTPSNIRRVADELARMRGAAMKIGQLLSMDAGDFLPPELAGILSRLRADADFMPPKQLRPVLDAAWGPGWMRRFARFEVRPVAAASIGQVHRAVLKDGRTVAIKVQYPGIAASIDSDVANVGTLLRLSGLVPAGFDIAPYLVEARAQLHDEADYAREGRYLALFGERLAGSEDIVVPERVAEFSGPGILTMTYLDGVPIETVADLAQVGRDRVVRLLLGLTLREMFGFGAMQTDPNFANYRYQNDTGRIVLLDFGAARDLSAEIPVKYAALMRAGLARDRDALGIAAREIGFLADGMGDDIRAAVLGMIATVFDATLRPGHFDFGTTDLGRVLQAQGEALARIDPVPPPVPVEALLIQRKLAGMFLLARRLSARVDLRGLVEEALGP